MNHTSIYKYLIINNAEDLIEQADRNVVEQHRPDVAAICSVTNPERNADDLGKPSIWKGRLDGLKDPVLIANRDQ